LVRAAALGALVRTGDHGAADLIGALGDDDPGVRRRAAELSGRWATTARLDPRLVEALVRTTGDGDALVAEAAAWALGEDGAAIPGPGEGRGDGPGDDAVAALSRMAAGHPDPLCREAAVAALGARGDPDGLPAVLGALDDRPALRRRAAVALAAFDDPRAEAGLRRCLNDRDWQVRQVAEDLLE
jgi:HEAT repeat protein